MLRTPKLNASFLVGSHQSRVGLGRITSFDLLDPLLWPRIYLAFWMASTHCWVHVELFVHQRPKSFSPTLFCIHSPLSLYLWLGLSWPTCRTLHMALLELTRFTQAHLPSLSRSQMVSFPSSVSLHRAPHSLDSSANLLGLHFIPCHQKRC